MSRIPNHSHATTRSLLPFIAVALVAFIALVFVILVTRPPATPASAPVPHFVDVPQETIQAAELRTLVIGSATERLPTSGSDGYLMSNLIEGTLPTDATYALVLSDSNCAPDAQGISHCFNQLDLNGTLVTVQHHHDMRLVPCLTPGETVTIIDVSEQQES